MSNATAVAPERATKAPSRAKTKLAPAPVIAPAAPATRAITEDESLVVQTMAEQLQAIYDMHNEQMSINGSELLQAAADDLVSLPNCDSALSRAVAMVYGAIAVERADRPGSPAIAPLLVVHQSLRTASHGYGLEQDGCEAMAEGIRAGLRQFQEQPTPPIRRVETVEPGQVTAETFSCDAGAYGTTMVIRCAYDIEAIAAAVTNLGDEAAARNDEHGMAALLRCYGNRVIELNAMVISHLDRDSITLSDVQYALYRGAQRLPTGALE